jgi:hypothetical protein
MSPIVLLFGFLSAAKTFFIISLSVTIPILLQLPQPYLRNLIQENNAAIPLLSYSPLSFGFD